MCKQEEKRGQSVRISPVLFLPQGPWGLNSGCQNQEQGPSPTERSTWPCILKHIKLSRLALSSSLG